MKVKMQPLSDDDVWRRFIEKPRFPRFEFWGHWNEAKGIFRLGRGYVLRPGIPGLWVSIRESTASNSLSFDRLQINTKQQILTYDLL